MTSVERKEVRFKRRSEKRNKRRTESLKPYDDFSLLENPDNLYYAFKSARKGVTWKESVQRYEASLLRNINIALKKLCNNESLQGGFVEFDIHERGKSRHIRSIHISERVIQKCLCDNILVPILSRSLIYDNAASLKNKGVHFSLRRLIVHLKKYYKKNNSTNDGYVLSIDFSKFFDSIRHDILIIFINKYIKDKRLLKLLADFIMAFGDNVSLGLGSQISQICAIFFPNGLDHFIKQELGIKYYSRYMDDIYLIHKDKDYLIYCYKRIGEYCLSLGLAINKNKTRIDKLSRGFIYLKGRYSLNEKGKIICLPCRASTMRMKKKLYSFRKILDRGGRLNYKDIKQSYQSWRNNFRKRFYAYFRIRKMDDLYNRLFIRTT
jgi:hypothetical protein